MNNPKLLKYSLAVICCIAMLWLLVLTIMFFKNLALTNSLLDDSKNAGQHLKIQVIEAQLSQLSELLSDSNQQTEPPVLQSQLTDMQQELRERIALLSEHLSGFVSETDFSKLKEQLQQQQRLLNQLQEKASQPVVTPVKTRVPNNLNALSIESSQTANLSFKVLGVELRGGQQLLSIMPTGKDAIGSVVLLSTGQSFGNWKLESINGNTATFKTDNQARRIRIPK